MDINLALYSVKIKANQKILSCLKKRMIQYMIPKIIIQINCPPQQQLIPEACIVAITVHSIFSLARCFLPGFYVCSVRSRRSLSVPKQVSLQVTAGNRKEYAGQSSCFLDDPSTGSPCSLNVVCDDSRLSAKKKATCVQRGKYSPLISH